MFNGLDKACAKLRGMAKISGYTLNDKTISGEIPAADIFDYEELFDDWNYGIIPVNSVKRYNGELYKCVSGHEASPANGWTPITYPAGWKLYHAVTAESARPYRVRDASDTYESGEYMIYDDGCVYECITDGTCWSPDVTPDRWRKVTGDDENRNDTDENNDIDDDVGNDADEPTEPETPKEVTYPEWEQRWAHNIYAVGEIVTYNGKLYRCTTSDYAYPPDVYGWELVK